MGYAFGKLQHCRNEVIVDLHSEIVTLRGSPRFKLEDNQSVILSWTHPYPNPWRDKKDGKFYASSDAVEPVGIWKRHSSYSRPQTHTRTQGGHFAELELIKMLKEEGIRAEHASDFEDIVEKVDLWVFIEVSGFWNWVPVDVTKLPSNCEKYDNKVHSAHRQGIVVHQFNPHMWFATAQLAAERFVDELRQQIKEMRKHSVEIKDRRQLMEKEVRLYPVETAKAM